MFVCLRWPLAFSRYFDVAKLDGPAWDDEMFSLAINSSGVYVVGESKQMLHKMAFHEIAQVLGDRHVTPLFLSPIKYATSLSIIYIQQQNKLHQMLEYFYPLTHAIIMEYFRWRLSA